ALRDRGGGAQPGPAAAAADRGGQAEGLSGGRRLGRRPLAPDRAPPGAIPAIGPPMEIHRFRGATDRAAGSGVRDGQGIPINQRAAKRLSWVGHWPLVRFLDDARDLESSTEERVSVSWIHKTSDSDDMGFRRSKSVQRFGW